jgi:hypothetical protein
MLADLAQPALKGSRIAWCLGVEHCCGLPQDVDAVFLDLSWFATLELGV